VVIVTEGQKTLGKQRLCPANRGKWYEKWGGGGEWNESFYKKMYFTVQLNENSIEFAFS
jgi:hypothetical protein